MRPSPRRSTTRLRSSAVTFPTMIPNMGHALWGADGRTWSSGRDICRSTSLTHPRQEGARPGEGAGAIGRRSRGPHVEFRSAGDEGSGAARAASNSADARCLLQHRAGLPWAHPVLRVPPGRQAKRRFRTTRRTATTERNGSSHVSDSVTMSPRSPEEEGASGRRAGAGPLSSASRASRLSTSTGLTRCSSNPAARLAARSAAWP